MTTEWLEYFRVKRDGARFDLRRLLRPGVDPDDPELEFPRELDPFVTRYRVSIREYADAESIHEVWKSYESIPTKSSAYVSVLFSRAYRELSKRGIKRPQGGVADLVSLLDKGGYLPEISMELKKISELDVERGKIRATLRGLIEERLQYQQFIVEEEKKFFMRYVVDHPDDMRSYVMLGTEWTKKMARFLELDESCKYPKRRLLLERMLEVEKTVELFVHLFG